jgi:hypothetical protein
MGNAFGSLQLNPLAATYKNCNMEGLAGSK